MERRGFLKGSAALSLAAAGCAPFMQREPADVLIVNGRVATLNPRQPNAQALAINHALTADDQLLSILGGDMNSGEDSEVLQILHDRWRELAIPGETSMDGRGRRHRSSPARRMERCASLPE